MERGFHPGGIRPLVAKRAQRGGRSQFPSAASGMCPARKQGGGSFARKSTAPPPRKPPRPPPRNPAKGPLQLRRPLRTARRQTTSPAVAAPPQATHEKKATCPTIVSVAVHGAGYAPQSCRTRGGVRSAQPSQRALCLIVFFFAICTLSACHFPRAYPASGLACQLPPANFVVRQIRPKRRDSHPPVGPPLGSSGGVQVGCQARVVGHAPAPPSRNWLQTPQPAAKCSARSNAASA